MEKTALGLVAALSALAASPAAASVNPTATDSVLKPASVAELLEPIPNALDVMQRLSADEGRTLAPVEIADDMEIGVPGLMIRHHHHHHHHHHYRRHHHHHHHHHNNY